MLPSTSQRPRTVEDLLGPTLVGTLDRLDIVSQKLLAGKLPGERRSKRRGRSVEFADFRPYVAGDDLRHIDWNILGRLDKLFVKLFREEEDLSLHVIIDASASMDVGEPNKLVYACRLAAALGYVGLVNQNRVTVSAIGLTPRVVDDGTASLTAEPRKSLPPIRRLAPMRGRTQVRRLTDFALELITDATKPERTARLTEEQYVEALRTLGTSSAGRGICVYISDMLGSLQSLRGLSFLTGSSAGTYDTWCIQVLSPGELDPTSLAEAGLVGDLRLTDAETAKAIEVTISPASIAQYKAGLSTHNSAVKRACLERGIAYALVDTSTPVDQLVLSTLRRGGLLR